MKPNKTAETAQAENTSPAVSVAKKEKKGDLMYLGPTIAGIARHSTVFKDGVLPKATQECIAELPMMEKLFVETGRLPEAIRELKKRQSALSAVYAQVEAHFSAGK